MAFSRDDWRRGGKSSNRGHHDRDNATTVGETLFGLTLECPVSTGSCSDKPGVLLDRHYREQT